MGTLVVIEGLDGSGKATLAGRLTTAWESAGRRVATMAFPRYGQSVHADLARDALYGRLGDITDSVHGLALLFALDRRDAADTLRDLLDRHDIVLLDRYLASNAAYGAARLGGPDRDTGFPEWVRALEIDRFGLPLPDRQVLLATDAETAGDRARARATAVPDRELDAFESDRALQDRTAAMYRQFVVRDYLAPWTVLTASDAEALDDPQSDALGRLGI